MATAVYNGTMRRLLAALIVCAPLIASADSASFGRMTPQEVNAKIAKKEKGFYVFDNNMEEVFKQAHVPGAKWVHPNEFTVAEMPADKNATLVFYCANEH
jgi:hypothetical protein